MSLEFLPIPAPMRLPCRPWKPAFSIKISILIVTCTIIVIMWQPTLWAWGLSLILANRIVLVTAGLFPRSTLLGKNITQLPPESAQRNEIAITIDDGPDPEVTPRVLEILDRHRAKATFFCIGNLAERHPGLCREIILRGHTIENHSQIHSRLFSLFLPRRLHREVLQSQQTLAGITGRTPRFFRPTAGLRNPELDPILTHHNLRLCSWSKRSFDTRERDPELVLAKLTANLCAGDILLLHDGNAARTLNGNPVILDVLPRLLDNLKQRNLHPVTLDHAFP